MACLVSDLAEGGTAAKAAAMAAALRVRSRRRRCCGAHLQQAARGLRHRLREALVHGVQRVLHHLAQQVPRLLAEVGTRGVAEVRRPYDVPVRVHAQDEELDRERGHRSVTPRLLVLDDDIPTRHRHHACTLPSTLCPA
eukprot:6176193-Pleurochrysis_carterae.AAC.1